MLLACVLTKTSHHQVGACQVGVQLTLVKTSQLVHQLGTSFTVTAPLFPLTLVTHVELVKYQSGLLELYGVYPRAVVTSKLVIQVINPESLFKSEISSQG